MRNREGGATLGKKRWVRKASIDRCEIKNNGHSVKRKRSESGKHAGVRMGRGGMPSIF